MESQPPFPVETLRYLYVTPFGGHSPDLRFFQVGINREALKTNTELDPDVDRVRIAVMGQRHVRPALVDGLFEIVPVDPSESSIGELSPRGEAVLPEGDEVVRRPFPAVQLGDRIVLNGVPAKRFELALDAGAIESAVRELLTSVRGTHDRAS